MPEIHTHPKKHNSHQRYDIVIIGAGLVGAACAALLAQSTSASIAVIDPSQAPVMPNMDQEKPEFDPRVVALTHTSQALFERLGLWDDILAQRACAYTKMQVWDNEGTGSIDFSAQDIQQPTLGTIVENKVLLYALTQYLEQEQPQVTLRWGVALDTLQQSHHDDSHRHLAIATCIDTTTNEPMTIHADLLIAADGGQSRVRSFCDVTTRTWDYEHRAIVATIQSEHSHRFTAWQNFLSTGPLAFLPLDHPSEQYCSIVWSVETKKAKDLMALDDQAFCVALGHAFEHRLGTIKNSSQRFSFPLVQRHAVDYSDGNIVLIGDAAHTIHPLAGQGVNLGLLDAQALEKEVTRAIKRGLAVNDPSLLRRYQRQRKGHNLEVMLLMEGLKRVFGSRQLIVRWLRNLGIKKVNQWNLIKNWLAKQAIHHEK